MRGRFACLVWCGVLALSCADEVPARVQESKPALTLLHTSDIHSRVWPFRSRISTFEASLGLGPAGALREVGGLARLAGLLDSERAGRECVWLDSGDALEGAGVFRRYGGRVELELLSGLGLAAMALGNHELSLRGQELAELLQSTARFPVLSANLLPLGGSALAGLVRPAALIRASGLELGVVGVGNPASPPNLAAEDNPWGLSNAELSSAVQLALDDVAPHAGVVVVLSHLGLEQDRALVAATSGIDLLLGGHQHVVTTEPEWQDDCGSQLQGQRGCSPRAVPIVHSGAYGKFLSRLELELAADSDEPGHFEIAGLSLEQLPLAEGAAQDGRVVQELEQYRAEPEAPLAFLSEPLWRRSALGGDSALGNLVADAVRQAAAVDVALLNSSGLRADLEPGLLLRSDVELALPFDEPWLVSLLSGRQLRAGLERAAWRSAARDCESSVQLSGLRLELACTACQAQAPECLSIVQTTPFGAKPLLDDQLLLVALPAYLALETADFEDASRSVARSLATPVSELSAAYLAESAPLDHSLLQACQADVRALSPTRCREAYGAAACPLSERQALQSCARLSAGRGGRDDRIRVRP